MAAGEERRKQALILSRVGRIRRRLNSQVWLDRLAVPLWCGATAVGAWRLLFHRWTWAVALGSAVVAAAWWIARSRGRLVSHAQAAVRADRLAGAGGLLLTRLELPVGEWELSLNERMHDLPMPQSRPARPGFAALGALLFLAAALAVPLSEPLVGRVNAAAAGKVAEVEAKAEALAKERPLEENVQKELERLRQEAMENAFDAKDWEAADGLEAGLDQKAAQAAADLARAAEAAKSLENALDEAQGHDGAAREREELERALASLSGGADNGEHGADNSGDTGAEKKPGAEGASSGNGPEGGKKPEAGAPKSGEQGGHPGTGAAGKRSKSDVSQLRQALEQRQKQLASAFGSSSSSSGARAQEGSSSMGKGTGTEVAQGEGEGDGEGDPDGPGAPVHGPGKGHLRFGPVPELHPERLQFAPLPDGHGGEGQQLWGLSAADPQIHAGGAAAVPGAHLAAGEQTPGHRQESLLPRNRELSRRYFEKSP
jgi:hypothetical protein